MRTDREMFEARQTMDALTTSSADRRETGLRSGRSGDANAHSRIGSRRTGHEDDLEDGQEQRQGAWSWFAPAKPHSAGEPHQHATDGEEPVAAHRMPSPIRTP